MVSCKLREIQTEEDRLTIASAIKKFTCQDKNVESFLKDKVFDFEQRNFSRTYFLANSSFDIDEPIILAYFTLTVKALPFLPNLSKRKIKEIDGFSKDASSAGSILIGQLGKDENLAQNIEGTEIMRLILGLIYQIYDIAACRVAFLECQPIDKLVDFYKSFGFEPLQSSKNGLLQMVRFL
jgi:hypothetical protein